jgi:hypothetical protein
VEEKPQVQGHVCFGGIKLNTAVYVGKNVEITTQVPVDNEEHAIPGSPPYIVTLNNGPVSDRNLNGTSNEVVHVSVVDSVGNLVTPAAVDDEAKTVTFDSGDSGKTVYITYRHDLQPYLAQELSIEPKQTIEGLDALGSDNIEAWAPLLKEYSGSIKEALKNSLEQLNRIEALRTATVEPFGIIVTWTQDGLAVKIGLDKVVFPEGSIASPKNAPVFITTPFKAQTVKTIT